MAFDLSFGSLGSAKDQLASMYDENKVAIGRATATAEIGVAAFGFGWLHGRYPTTDVFGVDISLLAGIGLLGLSFLDKKEEGESGAFGHHLASLGQGALSVYLAKLGADWGDSMNPASPHFTGTPVPGTTPIGAGVPPNTTVPVAPTVAAKGYGYPQVSTGAPAFQVSHQDLAAMAAMKRSF